MRKIWTSIKRRIPKSVKLLVLYFLPFLSKRTPRKNARTVAVTVAAPVNGLAPLDSLIPSKSPEEVNFADTDIKLIFIDRLNTDEKLEFVQSIYDEHQVLVLFRSKHDYMKFEEYLGVSLDSSRFLFVPTIDSDIDDDIYRTSRKFVDDFLDCSMRGFKFDEFGDFSEAIASADVALVDRVQGWVRCCKYIEKIANVNRVSRFYILSQTVSHIDLIGLYVKNQLNIPSAIILINGAATEYSCQTLFSKSWSMPWRPIISDYGIEKILGGNEEVVWYFGNLKDPQYRGTAKPVLQKLSSNLSRKVFVFQPDQSDSDLMFPNTEIICPEYKYYTDSDLKWFAECFDHSFVKSLSTCDQDSDSGVLRLFVMAAARRSIFRLFLDCYAIKKAVDKSDAASKVKAIISNPGRLWFSQFLTAYLKQVPSFEIQSGTLSRTLRYKAPNSQHILSVDDYSRDVYCEFLGVDPSRVYVVGAPRIDVKLQKIKDFDTTASREHLKFPLEHSIVCIATQPYGSDLMASMVKEVSKLLNDNRRVYLVVSMHPNESRDYERAYQSVLGNFIEQGRACISRGEIYHCMNASDTVITYFSTSGLEAFCLRKRVYSYRPPGQESVPFDLCKLGVAQPFSNGEELAALLNQKDNDRPMTEGLRNLQDGRSVSRICNFIAKRI